MNIHEYQAKEFLQHFGVPLKKFGVAGNLQEVEVVLDQLNLKKAVLKAQVHAGGRGKAGAVKFATSRKEIIKAAKELIGMKIINKQTGKEGIIAQKVLIEEFSDIKKEYYVGIAVSREIGVPVLILSPEGGMEIEALAAKTPEKILTILIKEKLRSFQLVRALKFMGWSGELAKQGKKLITNLLNAFFHGDASLLEINPLVLTADGQLIAADAKINVDENALFRQKELALCYDPTQISPLEAKAKEFDLSYISLDGNIGCMVNGAGLAMATMDIIGHFGGKPANFLDVGGSATKEKIAAGFDLITSDSNVKAILINIFGGIMDCKKIAEAIEDREVKVPIVVRLEGTNAEIAREILSKSNLKIIAADNLKNAAKKVAEMV